MARVLGEERRADPCSPRYHLYQRQGLRIRVHAYWPDDEGSLLVESHGTTVLRLAGEAVGIYRRGEWEGAVQSLHRLAQITQRKRGELPLEVAP